MDNKAAIDRFDDGRQRRWGKAPQRGPSPEASISRFESYARQGLRQPPKSFNDPDADGDDFSEPNPPSD